MTNSYNEQYAVKIKKYSAVIQAQNRYIILKTDDFDQASFFFKRIIKIEAHLNQKFSDFNQSFSQHSDSGWIKICNCTFSRT